MKTFRPSIARRALALLLAAGLAAACGGDDSASVDGASTTTASADPTATIVVVTHDSFAVSESVLESFTAETGIVVELLPGGDAGSMVNQAILTKGAPQGDVLFGIDNSLLSRAFDEDLFLAYESPNLSAVDPEVQLDDAHRVTPIDTGDVCLNTDIAGLAEVGVPAPTTLADLAQPIYADTLVVENPATSSPGLAFLLATIDEFGEDGWQAYWQSLVDNGVEVAAGWEEAYYGSFSGSAGSSGTRPIVVSYASSPPAEVVFSDPPVTEAPTGVVAASCYRQIEFAGVLAGTEHEAEAQQFIDFMLSAEFQSDLALQMFVYPVTDVALPDVFVDYGVVPESPYLLDADLVAANRDRWIDEWTDLVLR